MIGAKQTTAAILFVAVLILGGWTWSQDAPVASPSDVNPAIVNPAPDNPATAPRPAANTRTGVEPATGDDAAPAITPDVPTRSSATPLRQGIIASLTIFVLAVFVGIEVISKVPPTLHTPLMSGSNAISGITLVGAVIVASAMVGGISGAAGIFARCLGFIAVTLAMINSVGGFLVTHRMLAMFARK
ncbi:MAG: NAD(P) transhydrogenase subunit alpha [Pirellulaceae bacterium]|jgi:NAD(P) transhydrogenase subunit alpha|nr:NAD(P) transhydrogenase subunit alpha [Pirellulaceae bacterium]HJN09799.1 NAD(P) transhydrogenase subunit alpha [Pirellulaceae bacterium]